ISLMTATSLGSVASEGSADYLTAATTLALLSGLFLVSMGFSKLGFITNFLSQAVISGFISASGVIIALSQLKHILGVRAQGDTLTELLPALLANLSAIHFPTLVIGVFVLGFLYLARAQAAGWLRKLGLN